jgi:alkylation response protein AidB-like acyl-CoA dehydrogenase
MAERPTLRLIPNDEQAMLAETARKLVEERAKVARLRELRRREHPTGYSQELYREMVELGFTSLSIPEAHGGLGLGLFDLAQILESLGRELAPEPILTATLLGARPIAMAGSEAQKERYLSAIAAGETLVTLAYEEAGMRDRFFAPETALTRSSAGHSLTGTKIQVADALVADAFIVSCASPAGLRLALVDAKAKGVSVERQHRVDSRAVGIVRFEAVSVSEAELLSGEGEALLRSTLDHAAVGLAAEMLGAAEKAFADTVQYLKERVQFGVPIGSFQALQHRSATLYCELQLLRSVVLGAARAADDAPEAFPRLASLAKAQANETFLHVAKEAIQMHGGVGMTDEFDIGFYLKRAQAAAFTLGDTSHHRRRWAELNGY